MLVYDSERSERGPQRRRSGRHLLHCCCICGRLEPWGTTWSTYCSYKELDDEVPIPKFCSEKCRLAGGEDASLVTDAMRRNAKDAEWREPNAVFREQTEAEKYATAAYEQKRRRDR